MDSEPSGLGIVVRVVIALCAASGLLSTGGWRPVCAAEPDSLDRDYSDQLPHFAPLEPADALRSFTVSNGLSVELVAAEPLVRDPVAIDFDASGRLYVVEMSGYSEQGDEQLGSIRRLTDVDGDGRYDAATVFADHLGWPTGVACFEDGVFVADAPDILLLRDTDGDGRSDQRRVVFTGFGRENVQALVNNLQWGVDCRMHGATSRNPATVHRPDAAETPAQRLDGRDFAWNPWTDELEAETGGGQHGMTFDMWGHKFFCSNSDHLRQVICPEHYLARNPLLSVPEATVSIAEDGPAAEVYRASPVEPWRIVRTRLRVQGIVPGPVEGGGRPAGYFTSATGLVVYTGHLLGPAYHGRVFVGDVGSNLVHQKRIDWGQGVQAIGRRVDAETEFLRSTDTWFRPVQMANGPDGALYVMDMYREVIEHPWSLPPLIKQHLDLTSGRDRGRIYRIVPTDTIPTSNPLPAQLGSAQLVDLLSHPNGWHRLTASRLLCEHPAAQQVERLETLIAGAAEGEAAAAGRILALHILQTWGRLSSATLRTALADPHPQVRVHALRLAERIPASDKPPIIAALSRLVTDPDPEVRQQLAWSLGEFPWQSMRDTFTQLAQRDAHQAWHRIALLSSVHPHQLEALHTLAELRAKSEQPPQPSDLSRLARQLLVQGLSAAVDPPTLRLAVDALQPLATERPAELERLLRAVAPDPALANACLEQLADQARWDSPLGQLLEKLRDEAIQETLNSSPAESPPETSLSLLARFSWPVTQPAWAAVIDGRRPPETQFRALDLVGRYRDPQVATWLVKQLDSLTTVGRQHTLGVLLARRDWIDHWAAQLGTQDRHLLLADPTLRNQLRQSDHPLLVSWDTDGLVTGESDRAELIRNVESQWAELEQEGVAPDVTQGQRLFEKHCIACHGPQPIGPPRQTLKSRSPSAILLAVLDPNREVDPRYEVYLAERTDGRSLSGVLVAENATTVQFGLADGRTETILRNAIADLHSTRRSLMPEGLEQQLSARDLWNLSAFVRQAD